MPSSRGSAHDRRVARQAAQRFGVADQAHELFLHVPGGGDAVHVGHQQRGTDQGVDQRQLVRDRREPVVLDEGERQRPRELVFTGEKHALPGHEHVVEYRGRLHHLVTAADRVLDRRSLRRRGVVRRSEEHEAGRVDRDGEADCVVAVALTEGTRRQHDQLVGVGADRRVRLRAAHDDPVRTSLDDVDVVIGIASVRTAPASGRL